MTSPLPRPARLSLAAAALLALAGCASTDPAPQSVAPSAPHHAPAHQPTEASQDTTPTAAQTEPAAEPAAPRLIGYAGGESPGVVVRVAADAGQLHDAPAAFQDFIARTAQRVHDASTCEDRSGVGVTVQTLRTDGYAAGAVNDCGGYVALWSVVNGRWREIEGTQDIWQCPILAKYRVPSDVAGESCYDPDARTMRSYQQA